MDNWPATEIGNVLAILTGRCHYLPAKGDFLRKNRMATNGFMARTFKELLLYLIFSVTLREL
jgi:hypothetical protein